MAPNRATHHKWYFIGIWKHRKKGTSPEWRTDKKFSKSDLKQPILEKIKNLLKMFYTQKILKV